MSLLLANLLIFVTPLVNFVYSFFKLIFHKTRFSWCLVSLEKHVTLERDSLPLILSRRMRGTYLFINFSSQIQITINNNQVSRVSTFYCLWAWDPVNWQRNANCEKYGLTKPMNVCDFSSSIFWPQVTRWSCLPCPTTQPLFLAEVRLMSTTSSWRCTSTGARSRRTLWGGAQSTP